MQDQALLQFFLNVVEFGMNVQEATEAANIVSYQMRDSFADHRAVPGRMEIHESLPDDVRNDLEALRLRARPAADTRPARSTRSTSTASTARSGAARATTAKTTASRGDLASRSSAAAFSAPFASIGLVAID